MRRNALLASATLFVSASLAGLSGIGSVATATEAKTDRAPYIASADKICKASNDRLIAAAKAFETHEVAKAKGARSKKTKVAKPEQVAAFLAKIGVKEVTEELKQLSLLKAPSGDADLIAGLLKKAQDALAAVEKDPKGSAYTDPFGKVAKEFVAYGFTVCGHKIERPES
jgi:hypothetical protein